MPPQENLPHNLASPTDPGLATTQSMDSADVPGKMIGRYQLVRRLGQGGMGEVWLAEQKEPSVAASKLIGAGLHTREAITRFDSERQALALMDHPAIAKVFDADATSDGALTSSWSTWPASLSPNSATSTASARANVSTCSCRFARACSTQSARRNCRQVVHKVDGHGSNFSTAANPAPIARSAASAPCIIYSTFGWRFRGQDCADHTLRSHIAAISQEPS